MAPPVLGTVTSDNKATLNVLAAQGVTAMTDDLPHVPKVKLEGSPIAVPGTTTVPVQGRPKATAAAGSAAQLHRVKAELRNYTSTTTRPTPDVA